MSIVQNLMLKSFVIFCKYMVSKVSCLVSVSARSSLGLEVLLKVSVSERQCLVSSRSRRFWPRLQLWSRLNRSRLEYLQNHFNGNRL